MLHLIRRRMEAGRASGKHDVESSIGLDVSAFVGTANLFFTGLVILNLQSLPSIVHLSVVYLIVSAVAFIISSVIYANVVGTGTQHALRERMVQTANWVSEYPGVYLFMIAIPLLVLGVTNVLLVQVATAVACYGSLLLYSMSPFSIDHRRYRDGLDRAAYSALLAVFCIGVYLVGLFAPERLLPVGLVVMALLLAVSYFSFSFRITARKK